MASILVVDDDPEFCSYLEQVFEGHQVTTRGAGPEVSDEEILGCDSLVVDWYLPDGTGDEVVVRARALRPDVHVAIMSAIVGGYEMFSGGIADTVLDKTMSIVDLVAAVLPNDLTS